MSITRFASLISLAAFVFVAGCTTSKPDSEQLDQLMRRTSVLEQQVHDLEVSNAELQKAVRALQQQPPQTPGVPRWAPPQHPQAPTPNQPPPKDVPHLTPLDTN